MSRGQCVVYGICDLEGNVRYIGQTRSALKVRLKFHFKKPSGRIGQWLAAETLAGRKASVAQMRVLEPSGQWDVDEVLWIERGKALGWRLLNQTRGGRDGYCKPRRKRGRA